MSVNAERMSHSCPIQAACAFLLCLTLLIACAPAPVPPAVPAPTALPSTVVPLAPTATARLLRASSLSEQGSAFVANDSAVVLRGAVMPHFLYQQIVDHPTSYVAVFRRDIGRLRQMGANFIVVDWNAGYLSQPGYVENLVAGLEYAKQQGLWVELSLHSRGRKPGSRVDPLQIRIVDSQIVADWDGLLSDRQVASRLAAAVDMFGPLSEPAKRDAQDDDISWSDWMGIADKVIRLIRERIARPEVPIALSGVHWASDASDALQDPPDSANVAIELHPYQPNENNFRGQVDALMKRGYPVFAGELGCLDPIDYSRGLLDFLTQKGLSFAVYSLISDSNDPRCTLVTRNGAYSPLGSLAQQYFASSK